MLRLLPILFYLSAVAAILAFRFGAGRTEAELAEAASLAACAFAPEARIQIGSVTLTLPALEATSLTSLSDVTYDAEFNTNADAQGSLFGFCPDLPDGPLAVSLVRLGFAAQADFLTGGGVEIARFAPLSLGTSTGLPAPIEGDPLRLISDPGVADAMVTAGPVPDGAYRVRTKCRERVDGPNTVRCELSVIAPDLGVALTLRQLDFAKAPALDASLPQAMTETAAGLFRALIAHP